MPSPLSTPPAPPIAYGRAKNRAWRRVLVGACVLAVVASGIVRLARPVAAERYQKWRDHRATLAAMAKERARAVAFQREFLRQQSEAMAYTMPVDCVAYEEDAVRAAALLAANEQYRRARRHPFEKWDVPPDFVPPVTFAPTIFRRLDIPDLGPLFLHARHKPDGTVRLVTAGYTFIPSAGGARRLFLRVDATIPADETLYSWRQADQKLWTHRGINLRPADRFRLFWGQPAPGDRTRFSIRYELNGASGHLRFRLTDDILENEAVEGPLLERLDPQ